MIKKELHNNIGWKWKYKNSITNLRRGMKAQPNGTIFLKKGGLIEVYRLENMELL